MSVGETITQEQVDLGDAMIDEPIDKAFPTEVTGDPNPKAKGGLF